MIRSDRGARDAVCFSVEKKKTKYAAARSWKEGLLGFLCAWINRWCFDLVLGHLSFFLIYFSIVSPSALGKVGSFLCISKLCFDL